MQTTLIFGHRNPDTDSICSAIAYAELKTGSGDVATAVRLGDINAETAFVLEYFQVKAPRLITGAADEAREVILVDHNERQQSAPDIDRVRVVEVIDHHRIANFETAHPLYYRAEPVGCTATIINKLFKERGVAVRREIAGLMLSAIISDTLLFKSPTCTAEDAAATRELAAIAEVDAEQYGLRMLKAGADLGAKTVEQLLSLDAKEFPMGEYKVEIAQVNAIDVNDVLSRQNEAETAVRKIIDDKRLDLFVFVVTDILAGDSVVLALGRAAGAVERAYGVSLVNNRALLPGVVSRKKQIVPVLTDILATDAL